MVDFRYRGRGRVLHFGTVGWMRNACEVRDPAVRRITLNAIELLLNDNP